MPQTPTPPASPRRVPRWAVAVVPLLAAALSNADVLLLLRAHPRDDSGELRLTLAATVPLSILASLVTLWVLLRLRREIDRRIVAEGELRAALADLRGSLDRERLLRRELDHRVRNNLAALLGLVGMYEHAGASPAEIVRSLRGKIITLREAYALIAASHGEGLELEALLRAVLDAVLGPSPAATVTLAGPGVRLSSREANALGLIVQELLTNAAKHGALSRPGGAIAVTWSAASRGDPSRVGLRWLESPPPPPLPPPLPPTPPEIREGTGLTLIRGFARSDLRGDVSFGFEGGRWRVDLTAHLSAARPETNAMNGPRPLTPQETHA